MTQDTEDVVALLGALTNIAKAMRYGSDQAWIEEAIERITRGQSLSDRIDGLEGALGEARDELRRQHRGVDFDRESRCRSVIERIDAALHQEGIAP